ncbi:MAG: hypothetical protein JWP42_2349, partial [Pseudomonas sp.]|nr:hypothetical protein [Pseudomonas sp.]
MKIFVGRSDAFASKLAPTGEHASLWERASPRRVRLPQL